MKYMEIPSLLEMLEAGLHFGHRKSKWHPKMKPYIFGERNTIHIIDLEKTAQKLKETLEYIKEVAKNKGVILWVGTKKPAQDIIKKYASAVGMPYVIRRWIGGTLTNFPVISRLIKKYNDLRQKIEAGELNKYTKKEQHLFKIELERLNKIIGGMENLDKIPDCLFILDTQTEKTAVREAKRKKIPMVAVCDTNCDPEGISYVIPANDDAIKSIEMIARLIAEAIKEGKETAVSEGTKDLKPET